MNVLLYKQLEHEIRDLDFEIDEIADEIADADADDDLDVDALVERRRQLEQQPRPSSNSISTPRTPRLRRNRAVERREFFEPAHTQGGR